MFLYIGSAMSDNALKDEQQKAAPNEKKWVQFEENVEVPDDNHPGPAASPAQQAGTNYNGAVIDTETVQVDIDKVKQLAQTPVKPEAANHQRPHPAMPRVSTAPGAMRNISLNEGERQTEIDPSIQRGFGMHLYIFFYLVLVFNCLHHSQWRYHRDGAPSQSKVALDHPGRIPARIGA